MPMSYEQPKQKINALSIVIVVVVAVALLVFYRNYLPVVQASSVRGEQLLVAIEDSKNYTKPYEAVAFLLTKSEKISETYDKATDIFTRDRNDKRGFQEFSDATLGALKKALAEKDVRAFALLYSDRFEFTNYLSPDQVAKLQMENAKGLLEIANSPNASTEILIESAGLLSDGRAIPDTRKAIDYSARAWLLGSPKAAQLASNIASRDKMTGTALLWTMRCIEPCRKEQSIQALQRELTAPQISKVQNAAADKSVLFADEE